MNIRARFGLLTFLACVLAATFVLAQEHHDRGCPASGAPCTKILAVVAAPPFLVPAGPMQFITAAALGAAAVPLSPPSGATLAWVCVEVAGVRYRDDGPAPTSLVGIPWVPTSASLPLCQWYSGPLNQVSFIALSGSPTMDIAYYYVN